MTTRKISGIVAGLAAIGIFEVGTPLGLDCVRADDFSQTVTNAGKAVEESVKSGVKKTEDYLKSEKFHQDAHRFAQDTGKAVKNAGNWMGQKLDSMKK